MNLPQFTNPPCLIKATYSINTPMFAGGANPNEAELTPTSFKGVMRFWWRALNWSKIRLSKPSDIEALKALHKQEARLFGVATNNDENRTLQGQGACLINSINNVNVSSGNSPNLLKTFNIQKSKKYNKKKAKDEDIYPIGGGLGYLLGQGLYNYKKGISRGIVNPLQTFDIEFTVEQAYQEAVIDVLKIMGLLGGLGSRARHGFGSVTLQSLAQKLVEQDGNYTGIQLDINNPTAAIRDLLERYSCRNNTNLPPLSAFYQDTRIDVMQSSNQDALTLLNEVGEEEQMYRSYGRKGIGDNEHKVNGKKAEQNFKDDQHLITNLADRKYRGQITHPRRIVFGLPHHYRYSNGLKVEVDASSGRRASPLVFHIHKNTNNKYQITSCLLKSQFLARDATIAFSKNRRSANVDIDWGVINNFMDRPKFANKETL